MLKQVLLCGVSLAAPYSLASAEFQRVFLEDYPNKIRARIEQRERILQQNAAAIGRDKLQGVMEAAKLWDKGSTITIAFFGGSEDRCNEIGKVADEWTKHANIKFSYTDNDGKIRRWSPSDNSYAAKIRVAFSEPGFWSLVGNDSADERIVRPGEASMNLYNYDTNSPPDWKATVLHEFGHAIGFHHEHQQPVIPCDFRFDDDPGYEATVDSSGIFIPDSKGHRPGVYTVLSGPPNEWPRDIVDANLKPLAIESHRLITSDFDRDSIMLYALDAWMFRAGERSKCYTGHVNTELSDSDKKVAGEAYPQGSGEDPHREKQRKAYEALVPTARNQ